MELETGGLNEEARERGAMITVKWDNGTISILSPEALERAKVLTRHSSVEVEYWPTDDPTAEGGGSRESRLAAYRAVRDGLRKRIRDSFG